MIYTYTIIVMIFGTMLGWKLRASLENASPIRLVIPYRLKYIKDDGLYLVRNKEN